MMYWWIYTEKGEPKCSEKNLPQRHCPTKKHEGLESNPGTQKSARLSIDTAYWACG
jgi:hypothetical protein